MDQPIRIRGARQHNLKNVDMDLPRGALTVITGPSGSGKSSLALDTLFAAGQRRYVESLSTYAKQFLDRMEKPDVDRIEGLSPAVAIEQRNPTTTSRSTVGTATEIYDYLRLLFARAGRTVCPECGAHVRADSVGAAVDRVSALPPGIRLLVSFPLARSKRVSHRLIAANLRALGYSRVLVDGTLAELGDLLEPGSEPWGANGEGQGHIPCDLASARDVHVVVDRLRTTATPGKHWRDRLADSLATCFREGEGDAWVSPHPPGAAKGGAAAEMRFSEHARCTRHPEIGFLDPSPRLFSFNDPFGSCPACTGFGATLEYDPDLIVPDPRRSLDDGAVDPWAKPRYHEERRRLAAFAEREGVSTRVPWRELPRTFRDSVLQGKGSFQGVLQFLASKEPKRYKQYIRIFLRQYQRPRVCARCRGARLRPEALCVTVGDVHIGTVAARPVQELVGWLDSLDLRPMEATIARPILRELRARSNVLMDVGLGYLTLERQMRTVSGGEAQRISLANSLGSRLVDTLYVLDEPSIGLHPRDMNAVMGLLKRLRDGGNTVVVVEHARDAIMAADHIVELGPHSGDLGGDIVFQGDPGALASANTATGRYISGSAPTPGGLEGARRRRRPVDGARLRLEGATLHNVTGVRAEFPIGAMTAVTGVSGSGKSTLVHDILYRALERELRGGPTSARRHLGEAVGAYRSLDGLEHIKDVVLIDQSPIGRTPRSNPVTYIQAWSEIRRIFAEQPAARRAGMSARSFSFNVTGGRCEECRGAGHVRVEMVFMADIHVPCEICLGKRYRRDVLGVEVRGLSVHDVLQLTVERAMRFFLREHRLGQALWHLQQVGLGYLRLGQAATTLSGGEAQRLKIARELLSAARRGGKGKLYILDEPTTGLSGNDVAQLNDVLSRLVDSGHTLIVVEHDLDVIARADWVVDMGPGAGADGGRVVAMGRPEEVAAVPESVTGRYLGG